MGMTSQLQSNASVTRRGALTRIAAAVATVVLPSATGIISFLPGPAFAAERQPISNLNDWTRRSSKLTSKEIVGGLANYYYREVWRRYYSDVSINVAICIDRRVIKNSFGSVVGDTFVQVAIASLSGWGLNVANADNVTIADIAKEYLDTGEECRHRRLSLVASTLERELPPADKRYGYEIYRSSEIDTEADEFAVMEWTMRATVTIAGFTYKQGSRYLMGFSRTVLGAIRNSGPVLADSTNGRNLFTYLNKFNGMVIKIAGLSYAKTTLVAIIVAAVATAIASEDNRKTAIGAGMAAGGALGTLYGVTEYGYVGDLTEAALNFYATCRAIGFLDGVDGDQCAV